MRMLLWDADNKFVSDEFGEIPLVEKPTLPFEFDALRQVIGGEMWIQRGDQRVGITPDEMVEINNFITEMRKQYGVRVLAVDIEGRFIGLVKNDDPQIGAIVPYGPSTDEEWRWKDGTWLRLWHIGVNGQICPESEAVDSVLTASAPHGYCCTWDPEKGEWSDSRTLQEHKQAALEEVILYALRTLGEKMPDYANFLSNVSQNVITSSTSFGVTESEKSQLARNISLVVEEINTHCSTEGELRLAVGNLSVYAQS